MIVATPGIAVTFVGVAGVETVRAANAELMPVPVTSVTEAAIETAMQPNRLMEASLQVATIGTLAARGDSIGDGTPRGRESGV
ncbi:MAG: hypothetical protein ACLPR9_13020 [Acidimicrobiales bacterium]